MADDKDMDKDSSMGSSDGSAGSSSSSKAEMPPGVAKSQKSVEEKTSRGSENETRGKKERKREILAGFNLKSIHGLIKKQMDKKTRDGEYFPYKHDDIVKILMFAKKIFKKESPLIEIKPPVVVVGDLHGQYPDLIRTFGFFEDGGKPGYACKKYLFLGDYIDRGKQSLECVMLVLMFKILYPDSFVLLRGNHESRAINRVYGFYNEVMERFQSNLNDAELLWGMFNDSFSYMPLACLVGGSILCMHGGISPQLNSLDDIRKIPKPLPDPTVNQLAMDLLWSDPMIGLKGFQFNKIRGVSVHFGEDTVEEMCKRLKIHMVIRAHQMMMNGFNFFAGRKLITIFTAASYYPDRANHGAVVIINKDGRVGFKILTPAEAGRGEKVFRGAHEQENDQDIGHIVVKRPGAAPETPATGPPLATFPPTAPTTVQPPAPPPMTP